MQGSTQLSKADWEQWRNHPATEQIRVILVEIFRLRRDQMLQAYWAGNPASEFERLQVKALEQVTEDIFESTHDDLTAMQEWIEANGEHERDHPG